MTAPKQQLLTSKGRVNVAVSGANQAASRKLSLSDFERLEIPYLNSAIRISQAMAWFNGHVVLGTGRAALTGISGRRSKAGGSDSDGAQILIFNPAKRLWSNVYESPVVEGQDGRWRARDRSIRAAEVCQTAADRMPCLYVGAGSLEGKVVFLRSEDGTKYQECRGAGFNLEADVPSVRAMACLGGALYTSPTGRNNKRGMWDDNLTDYPIVFATADPLTGKWVAVSEPGFGDPDNLAVNELAVFTDHLYAATVNPRYGFQLWKSDVAGSPPYRWRKILDRGAWRGAVSSIPTAMKVFGNALYVGAAIQRQGRGHLDNYGPFPAELIRVHPDDSWDIVAGSPRFTPHGLKRPVSGLTGGFGDPFVHNFWRMAVQDETLYVGTAGWKWMPTYLRDRYDLTDGQYERLQLATEDYIPGEYALWRTQDGVRWEALTRSGFPGGSPHTFGIRELLATPNGLFVAPTSKVGSVGGGGLELWWGKSQ